MMHRKVIGIYYEYHMQRINVALRYGHSSGGTSIYIFSKSKNFVSQHKTVGRHLSYQVEVRVLYIRRTEEGYIMITCVYNLKR
jgi:hypothetical protein